MTTNLFAGVPDEFLEELLTPLLNAPPVRIERIVSKGRQLLVRTVHARMGGRSQGRCPAGVRGSRRGDGGWRLDQHSSTPEAPSGVDDAR